MNAKIVTVTEEFPVQATWKVVFSGGLKDLISSVLLDGKRAAALFAGGSFTLKMNDGRKATMFITRLCQNSEEAWVPLKLGTMIQAEPDKTDAQL